MSIESGNPYAPPRADIGSSETNIDLGIYDDASKKKRFLNWLIDWVCTIVLGTLIGIGIGMLSAMSIEGPMNFIDSTGRVGEYVLGHVLTLTYYGLMEGFFGLTLGKLITGTRVVDGFGKKPTWGAVIGRSFARIVPFEPFSFLGDGSGWHDSWSDTRVVDIRNPQARLSPGLRKIYGR